MTNYAWKFTVVKFIPDPIKNESRNIGVIAQCSERGYLNCKFVDNLRWKLGEDAVKSDRDIIKAYIQDFTKRYAPYSKIGETENLLLHQIDILQPDYLDKLFENSDGKIVFTEPRGGLSANPEQELNNIFSTFIGEEKRMPPGRRMGSLLRTDLRADLKQHKILASKKKQDKRGFIENVDISDGDSHLTHKVDFGFKNSKWHVIETVDMRPMDQKKWVGQAYEAAFKFGDLTNWLKKSNISTYSVVYPSENGGGDKYMNILSSYSEIIDYTDQNEKRRFYEKMHNLVDEDENLFSDS